MTFIWFLFALVLAAPAYAVWLIQRFGKHELRDRTLIVPQPPAPLEIVPETKSHPVPRMQVNQAREVQWISISQFMTVVKECKDIIVVDLRVDEQRMVSPIPAAFVLPVMSDELDSVLGWLPADRSVAFCGASKLSIITIVTSPCMEGLAPLYLLESDLRFEEVA